MALELLNGGITTECVKKGYHVCKKAYKCRPMAKKLREIIEDIQPIIREIQYSGVDMPSHRAAQMRMFTQTLEEGKKLIETILKCKRWDILRKANYVDKMNELLKEINASMRLFIFGISADAQHLQVTCDSRFDGIDRKLDMLTEQLGSMRIRGGDLVREAMMKTDEMTTDADLGNVGVGLELGKKKVKEMLIKSKVEGRLIGISGMGGLGKTTLAKELEKDDEIQRHFQVLFVTVSQSPDLKDLRDRIWKFLTGFEVGSGASLPQSIARFEHGVQNWKLVILDDVWTRDSLDQLMFKIPGSTTLVVSRTKLADPENTYNVELLKEEEATSLFCLSAFGQKSIRPGFSESLVKQIVDECNGLPLSLKVLGASLKNKPEKYWEGVGKKLSKGEAADETHESRVFAHIKASIDILKPKTRECFLDLAAFPEDKRIPLDILISMWVELHDLEEETAFATLVDLSDRNLLTLVKDPRFGTLYTGYYDVFVTQHDVLRDLALHLSNVEKVNQRERLLMPIKESVLPREWERNQDEPYNARIVSIHTGDLNERYWFDLELPKTEVLILNFSSDNYVLPPFIAKMSKLKVLVIINNGTSPAHLHDFSIFTNLSKLRSLWLERVRVPELSNSTVPLKNLHKMSLVLCKINNSFAQTTFDISQIFPNLSDLTIDHCDDLVELPSTICKITSLNSISITNCPRIKELPKNLSKLQALELLRLYACTELNSLPNEICELSRLNYIDISQCLSLSSLPEEIGKLKTVEKIDMRECSLMGIPSSAVQLSSLRHVICDEESVFMWEEVKKVVPRLHVEAAEKHYSINWLDD